MIINQKNAQFLNHVFCVSYKLQNAGKSTYRVFKGLAIESMDDQYNEMETESLMVISMIYFCRI